MKKTETKQKEVKGNVAEAKKDLRVGTRGKIFEGFVIKKFSNRVVIEFERMNYIRKYERYAKYKTKIHARLPLSMNKEVQIGDLIQVRECRPLSKIIHFVVVKKIKDAPEVVGGKK